MLRVVLLLLVSLHYLYYSIIRFLLIRLSLYYRHYDSYYEYFYIIVVLLVLKLVLFVSLHDTPPSSSSTSSSSNSRRSSSSNSSSFPLNSLLDIWTSWTRSSFLFLLGNALLIFCSNMASTTITASTTIMADVISFACACSLCKCLSSHSETLSVRLWRHYPHLELVELLLGWVGWGQADKALEKRL